MKDSVALYQSSNSSLSYGISEAECSTAGSAQLSSTFTGEENETQQRLDEISQEIYRRSSNLFYGFGYFMSSGLSFPQASADPILKHSKETEQFDKEMIQLISKKKETAPQLKKDNVDAENTRQLEISKNPAAEEPSTRTMSFFQKIKAYYFQDSELHRAVLEDDCEKIMQADPSTIDLTNTHGDTPLHYAAREGSYRCLRALFYKNANCNAQNKWGDTPLHIAARRDDSRMVILLLNKAEPSIKNNKNIAALDLAKKIQIRHPIESKIKHKTSMMQLVSYFYSDEERLDHSWPFESLGNALYFFEPYSSQDEYVSVRKQADDSRHKIKP